MKNPANGGTPANEKNIKAMNIAKRLLYVAKAEYSNRYFIFFNPGKFRKSIKTKKIAIVEKK